MDTINADGIDTAAIREGSPLNPYRIDTGRTVQVDGFAYATTAPDRRISRTTAHYVSQAADAAAGMTFPALELTLAAAENAAGDRD